MIVAASTVVLAAFFFWMNMNRMKPELVSDEEILAFIETSHAISEDEFDAFYDVVRAYLKKQGSFSDGGLEEADFSSSRWVDPMSTLTVVSNVPVTQVMAESLILELEKLKKPQVVVFDGGIETCCVTSDGRFLKSKN